MNIFTRKSIALPLLISFILVSCQQSSTFVPEQPLIKAESILSTQTIIPVSSETPIPSPIPTDSASFALVKVTFINNAGFLIDSDGRKILIDALYEGSPLGSSLPSEVLRQVVGGEPPFDEIDLLLITHEHSDHFSAEIVLEFLENNTETLVVSNQIVVEEILTHNNDLQQRVIPIQLTENETKRIMVANIELEILNISHGVPDLLNLGFVIDLPGGRLFHSGDMSAADVSLADLLAYELPQKQLDIAFLPFYMFQNGDYHAHIRDGIKARNLIPMHYPYDDPPQGIDNYFPDAIIFSNSMEMWELLPDA